jgi:Leucine-rich repeat (LRR) protein
MLKFTNTQITELPEGLDDIVTDLDLSDSKIEKLPKTLTIQGNLIIKNAPITSLPEDLIVTGDLDLTDSLITSIPDSAFIGGDIIGKKVKYNPPELYNGRITSKVVMWKNKIMPYRHTSLEMSRQNHAGGAEDTVIVYYGLSLSWNAIVVYKNKWFYFIDKRDSLEPIYKDIEYRKQKERIGKMYQHLKLTDTFTLDEIFPIYQNVTGCCNDAYQDFLTVLNKLNYSTEEKIPLSMWIEGSKNAIYKYNYLFVDYFLNLNKEEDAE